LYSHILIGLNHSDAAQRALRRAIHLAAGFNATLTVVAVIPALPSYTAFTAALGPEAIQTMQSNQQELFADLLEKARKEATQQAIKIQTALISGSAVVSLIDAVRMNHVDLLVLGIHPEHDLLGWMSGNTAHKLALGVPCDVLGVH
jgi:nucleotide-binding universal stress UspA family protein